LTPLLEFPPHSSNYLVGIDSVNVVVVFTCGAGASFVSAHTMATIQPITVHPESKSTKKIALDLVFFLRICRPFSCVYGGLEA
jgi:hypothetical protein